MYNINCSESCRALLDLCREVKAGCVYDISIVNGEPIMDPPPKFIKEDMSRYQFPVAKAPNEFYELSAYQEKFVRDIEDLGDGTILYIFIWNGQPIMFKGLKTKELIANSLYEGGNLSCLKV